MAQGITHYTTSKGVYCVIFTQLLPFFFELTRGANMVFLRLSQMVLNPNVLWFAVVQSQFVPRLHLPHSSIAVFCPCYSEGTVATSIVFMTLL